MKCAVRTVIKEHLLLLCRSKSLASLMSDAQQDGCQLRRALNAWDLTAIGIGCMIGVGIFVLPGVEAARHSGPGIIVSFAVAAAACACAALCYAELAAMIPVSGSAYTYGYATLGEFVAWVIGWALILEYMLGASLVAIGWSAYLVNLVNGLGVQLPQALTASPFGEKPGSLDLPAALVVLSITALLSRGIKESARFNLLVVFIKVAVILVFIVLAARHVDPSHWKPFAPFGWGGIMTSAAVVFLAYIGFDTVSTAAEEAIRPQRDLPIGIIASLVITTFLYIVVAALMTGIVPYHELGVADPVALVLNRLGMPWASALISCGAIAGITSVLLVLLMGQPRILLAMSRDGLLPGFLSRVHPRFKTPFVTTWMTGVIIAVSAALTPITIIAELCSIGTIFAFIIVCMGVLILRGIHPHAPRPFRTPLTPFLQITGILLCGYLMVSLPLITWKRFIFWLLIGIAFYFSYGFRRSRLSRPRKGEPPEQL